MADTLRATHLSAIAGRSGSGWENAIVLWNASSLRGYSVMISGEQAGTLHDFALSDSDWTIAALVIETGSWLSSRRICVPVSEFGHPVAETRQILLCLSQDQLTALPDTPPGSPPRLLGAIDQAAVEGSDANVGHVLDFLVDAQAWAVKYLVINPSDWLSDDKVLMPVGTVAALDFAQAALTLNVTRQFVQDGPHYDPAQTVDGACDEKFLTYYGIRFVRK